MSAFRLVFGVLLTLVPVLAVALLAIFRGDLVYELGEGIAFLVAAAIFVASLPFAWLGVKLAWNALSELQATIDGEDTVRAERLNVRPIKTPDFPTWTPRGYEPCLTPADRPFHVGDVVSFKLGLNKEPRSGLVVGVRLEALSDGSWHPVYLVLPEDPIGGAGRTIRLLTTDLAPSRTPTRQATDA